MKRRWLLPLAGGLVIAGILAFFLQDVIRRDVVTPLAYLLWALELVYSIIPQIVLWILLVVGMFLITLSSLANLLPAGRRFEQSARPPKGPLESLAVGIANTREGLYYKWVIANRLGRLEREISGSRADQLRSDGIGGVETAKKSAPAAVRSYLNAGLNESFVDYPAPALPFRRRTPTPFDLDVGEAVEYLESKVEANHGKKHS